MIIIVLQIPPYNRNSKQQPVPPIDNFMYSQPEYAVTDESKCTAELGIKCYGNPVYEDTTTVKDLEQAEDIYETLP